MGQARRPPHEHWTSLNTPADIALATADIAVNKARGSAALTAEQLADLLSPADPLLLRSKEKELALAETSLAEVEALLADLPGTAGVRSCP